VEWVGEITNGSEKNTFWKYSKHWDIPTGMNGMRKSTHNFKIIFEK